MLRHNIRGGFPQPFCTRGETVSARDLVPVYLRLSQAERERLAKGLKITLD